MADFLVHVYNTAIGAVHHGFPDGSSVANNTNLSSLINGIFNERPQKRTLLPVWDLPLVLHFIALDMASLHCMGLLDLSRRSAFLLPLASGRRCSKIHALSVSSIHLRFRRRGVTMLLAKNQSMDFTPSPIELPDLRFTTGSPDDAPWCPVRSLKAVRKGEDQLFLCSHPPHGPASKATIARWVRDIIACACQM